MPAAAAQQLTARPVLGLCLAVGLGLAVVWLSLGVAFYSTWPVGFFVSSFGFATYLAAAACAGPPDVDGSTRRPEPVPPRTPPGMAAA